MNRLLLKWTGTNTNLYKLRAADRAAAKAKLRLMPPDRLLVDLEEEIFREMMQEVAAEEGWRLIEENERLKADPNFVVPEETHKRMMDLIMGG